MQTPKEEQSLEERIDAEERAMKSLVAFRKEFIPSDDDVKPAKFRDCTMKCVRGKSTGGKRNERR